MKTRILPLATVVLGALGASFAACATSTEGVLPPGSEGGVMNGSGGAGTSKGGSAPNGAGGAAFLGAGAPTGLSGAPSFAGAPVFGGAGAPVTGGAGAPATGGAGAPATGGCVAAMGTATDLAIDDLEDGDNTIKVLGQRVGYWYTFNDGTGVQTPAPAPAKFLPAMGGHLGMFAATTTGTAFTLYGAGMGFDFNNTVAKSCPYNASAYAGIKFWAKGNVLALKAVVKIPATTPLATGGSCTPSTVAMMGCEDHFGAVPRVALTATWTQYTLDFATIAQEHWGLPATFSKAAIMAVQFQVDKGVPFDFSIDDVTFY